MLVVPLLRRRALVVDVDADGVAVVVDLLDKTGVLLRRVRAGEGMLIDASTPATVVVTEQAADEEEDEEMEVVRMGGRTRV